MIKYAVRRDTEWVFGTKTVGASSCVLWSEHAEARKLFDTREEAVAVAKASGHRARLVLVRPARPHRFRELQLDLVAARERVAALETSLTEAKLRYEALNECMKQNAQAHQKSIESIRKALLCEGCGSRTEDVARLAMSDLEELRKENALLQLDLQAHREAAAQRGRL